jgi:hypothetical protein
VLLLLLLLHAPHLQLVAECPEEAVAISSDLLHTQAQQRKLPAAPAAAASQSEHLHYELPYQFQA